MRVNAPVEAGVQQVVNMIEGGRDGVDAGSFDAAFVDLFDRAYRVAFRLLGSRHDAEDIAQEAMARAYTRWSSLGSTTPQAWVSVVAANLAIDAGRRRLRRRRAADQVHPNGSEAATVERLVLREVLASLSGRQRDVLVLRYLVDMPEAEVAAALGVSMGSVKQHASRGCAQLRERLGGERHEEESDVRAFG